jgi:hypothetical protein
MEQATMMQALNDHYYRLPGEVLISDVQVDQNWGLYRTEPMIRTVRDQLCRELVRNGLRRTKGKRTIESTLKQRRVEKQFMLPMVYDMVDTLFVMGIVPVAWVSADDEMPEALRELFRLDETLPAGTKVPIVPQPGTYEITMLIYRGHRIYRFWWKTSRIALEAQHVRPKWDPDVQIFERMGWEPTITGQLNTPVTTLWAELTWINALRDCHLNAVVAGCNPVLVTERPDETTGDNPTNPNPLGEGTEHDYFADGDQFWREEQSRFYRTKAGMQLERVQNQLFLQQQVNLGTEEGAVEETTRVKSMSVNQLRLPAGRKVARPNPAQHVSGLVDTDKLSQEKVCIVMGWPRSTMINDSARVSGNVSGINDTKRSTLIAWRDAISYILTDLDRQMWDGSHMAEDNEELEARIREESEASQGDSLKLKRRIAQIYRDYEFELSLAVSPQVTTGELVFMNSRGIIDWKTFATAYLELNNMNTEGALANPKDPWPQEAVRSLAGGKEAPKPKDPAGGGAGNKKQDAAQKAEEHDREKSEMGKQTSAKSTGDRKRKATDADGSGAGAGGQQQAEKKTKSQK